MTADTDMRVNAFKLDKQQQQKQKQKCINGLKLFQRKKGIGLALELLVLGTLENL